MGGTGVIDRFLQVFTSYIDSGFGLLGGEVAFIATTLIVIDVTLAALFWSWGADDDIIARLVKKNSVRWRVRLHYQQLEQSGEDCVRQFRRTWPQRLRHQLYDRRIVAPR